jgi:DNA-binding IclR family transcriptional regulator
VTTIIVRSRPGQATARPFLRRAQRTSRGRHYSYHPLWTDDRAQALELKPAAARALLAWLRKSRLAAGYQYSAPGLAEAPAVYPDAEEKARRRRLVLEALTELGAAGSEALARRCGLNRHQTMRVLNHLKTTGAVTRSAGQFTGTWRATTPYLALDAKTFDEMFVDHTKETP